MVFCKNARLNGDTRLAEVLAETADFSWDFICFSETRAADDDVLLRGGHKLLSSLGDTRFAGVAILIHKRWVDNIIDYKQASGRVMHCDIRIGKCTYRFVATYLPHAGYPDADFRQCMQHIRNTVAHAHQHKYRCVIGGDFNAEIGRGWRGAELESLAAELGLVISNVNENEDLGNQWTFRSCVGRRRRLDYILVDAAVQYRNAKPSDLLDLSSDHRAVKVCIEIPPVLITPRLHRPSYKNVNWDSYATHLPNSITEGFRQRRIDLADLERCAIQSASLSRFPKKSDAVKEQSTHLERLRRMRRATSDPEGRRDLSKQIWRLARKELRIQKTRRTTDLLTKFSELKKLETIHRSPVTKASTNRPNLDSCSKLLGDIYKGDIELPDEHAEGIDDIAPFRVEEVVEAIRHMSKGKAADRDGVLLEMFLFGGDDMLLCLTEIFNDMLQTGDLPPNWRESFFTLLHKGGDAADPNNWRPIAILSITYKIFARVIFNRIRSDLDAHQSEEQFGFRKNRSTSDALIVAESIISKSLEFNEDLWLVSVDLRKAFDRVEQAALFKSLHAQGLPLGYSKIIRSIYKGQVGIVGADMRFPITRGVRQGDVLSPLLFNCVLEDAMREWKSVLRDHGVTVSPDGAVPKMTNVRFADDLLLFAKTCDEAVDMLEILTRILRRYGLELNVKKTKMLSTVVTDNETVLVDTDGGFVELVAAGRTHKYLGRSWPGNLRFRGQAAVDHRVTCAWAKFRSLQGTLLDRNISVKLRLKLFNTTVTPAAAYSLETCPLSQHQLDRLDIVQKRMLRRIVGWIGDADDSWEDMGRRMKVRLQTALQLHPVEDWSRVIRRRKIALLHRITSDLAPTLTKLAHSWSPVACAAQTGSHPRRTPGRPRRRWNDEIHDC